MKPKIMDITTGEYVANWNGTMKQLEEDFDDEKYLLVDASNNNEIIDPNVEEIKINPGLVSATGEHDTELDSAGWGGRARLTCHSCGETCLKQPYMGRKEWREKVNEFTLAHPSEASEQYNKSLVRSARPGHLTQGENDGN